MCIITKLENCPSKMMGKSWVLLKKHILIQKSNKAAYKNENKTYLCLIYIIQFNVVEMDFKKWLSTNQHMYFNMYHRLYSALFDQLVIHSTSSESMAVLSAVSFW